MGGSITHFQRVVYVACLFSFSTEAFLVYNLAFLNLQPHYKCVTAGKEVGEPFTCKREATCSAEFNRLYDPGTSAGDPQPPAPGSGYFFVDTSGNATVLTNWVQDLNLRCADAW